MLHIIGNNQNCSEVKWHHACYSNFTHQGNCKLRKKRAAVLDEAELITTGLDIKQPSTRIPLSTQNTIDSITPLGKIDR